MQIPYHLTKFQYQCLISKLYFIGYGGGLSKAATSSEYKINTFIHDSKAWMTEEKNSKQHQF